MCTQRQHKHDHAISTQIENPYYEYTSFLRSYIRVTLNSIGHGLVISSKYGTSASIAQ